MLTMVVSSLFVGRLGLALPVLQCQGDVPAFVVRGGTESRLNAEFQPFKVFAREGGNVVFGPRPRAAWLKLQLTDPLTWQTTPRNYAKFLLLEVHSDRRTGLRLEVTGIFTHYTQKVVCALDDDIRAEASL